MLQNSEKYVIQVGNQFLVGCPYKEESVIRLSDSKYDGYRTENFMEAMHLARRCGGLVMKLNELNGALEGGW